MMKPPLNAILLGDSEIDEFRIAQRLESEGRPVDALRINTAEGFREALSARTWDLVVCGHTAPRRLAPAALALVREQGLDLPFIVVSEAIGAERAVEIMRSGAHDLVFQNELDRLAPAVERALEAAAQRRTQQEAEKARRNAEQELRNSHEELELRVRERTAELSAANERLRELDRLKSEFLATMSHELRTPLNSIIGFTSLVRQELTGPLNEEQKKQLGMVYNSGKHLLELINDLLDLSRIEAGRIQLDQEPFDFSSVVAEVVAQIKPLAQAKRLLLRPQVPPGIVPMIGDRRRCLQILLNLAHNAVKYTEKGSIDIIVRCEGALLRIHVIDTGPGIKPEQLGHLFEAFRQLDGTARRAYEGTGLGLYLCRKLLGLMQGEISAQSVYGQGTCFTVSLPRRLAGPDKHASLP
jgi:signal transduction histidine kinase